MNKAFESCRPAVHRYWLVFAAGVLWLSVGIGLMLAACFWLYHSAWPTRIVLAVLSFALGLTVYSFGFSRIVRKNLERIGGQPHVVCFFAFQGWRSYFLVFTMILMGYVIRHLPIPRDIVAVVYFTMGSALCFGSSLYFRQFSEEKQLLTNIRHR